MVSASPLRDADIRRPLHIWLEKQHECCSETGIIHELRIPRPSARADLAVINGEMVGYEIKSDVDNLARLPRQTRAFNRVFDRAYVVATERHARQAAEIVPEWWGVAIPALHAAQPFIVVREADLNPSPSIEAALFILRKPELIRILEWHNLAKGMRDKKHSKIVRLAASGVEHSALKADVRRMLRARLIRAPHSL